MLLANRRYDIDWIRVIAIGLLLFYHVAIGFQVWGMMIMFITNGQPWGSLWIPMEMLNIWRIPLLFFVSGMGVYFAMQNRTWKELLKERGLRILVPLLVGSVIIVPVHVYLWQRYYGFEKTYAYYNPGHLWFLGNIMIYVLLFVPLFYYLKRNENGKIVRGIRKMFSSPLGLLPVLLAFVAEALILKPYPYPMYAMTWHGFFLGLLAFFFGFCFVLAGNDFWKMILKLRWLFMAAAVTLFAIRFIKYGFMAPGYLIAIESQLWILTVFAFGHRYLNHGGKTLRYLSEAAYPVYVIHMMFLYLGSSLIFPLNIAVQLKFVVVLMFTLAGCFAFYEFIIRRIKFIRPLFGLKKI